MWVEDFEAYRAGVALDLAAAAEATGLGEEQIAEAGAGLRDGAPCADPRRHRADADGRTARASCADYRRSRSSAAIGGRRAADLSILSIAELPEAHAARPDLIAGNPRSLDIAKLGDLSHSARPAGQGPHGVVGQSGGHADRRPRVARA